MRNQVETIAISPANIGDSHRLRFGRTKNYRGPIVLSRLGDVLMRRGVNFFRTSLRHQVDGAPCRDVTAVRTPLRVGVGRKMLRLVHPR